MSSAGEDRLAEALVRKLRDPWHIYRNVAWLGKAPGREPQDGEADVVIAHPDLGVMVIEVKGGGVRRIGPNRWESVDRSGAVHTIKDPFAQATRAMHGLRRTCEEVPGWPAASVRFTRAIAFPDATYDPHPAPLDGPREIVIDRDDLARAGSRVRDIFDWWSASGDASTDGGPLTPAGMEALDTLLARPMEIPSPLAAGIAADEELIALSAQQFGLLDSLTAQRRALILGVAGSGKTLLAAEKARRLAAQGFDVLLTCFNRPLAEHLAATIGRTNGVTVSTFHRLAETLGQAAGLIGTDPARDTPYFDTLPEVLDRALGMLPAHRYDAIVVDEGQDLDSVWWLPLLDLLRDAERGIVYVFGDANQDLYHAREPFGTRCRDARVAADLLPQRGPSLHPVDPRVRGALRRAGSGCAAGDVGWASWPRGGGRDVSRWRRRHAGRPLPKVLRGILDAGKVAAGDVVVLTPRSPRSSWLMHPDGKPVEVWPYRFMPEYGPDGAVLPPPTRGRRGTGRDGPSLQRAGVTGGGAGARSTSGSRRRRWRRSSTWAPRARGRISWSWRPRRWRSGWGQRGSERVRSVCAGAHLTTKLAPFPDWLCAGAHRSV